MCTNGVGLRMGIPDSFVMMGLGELLPDDNVETFHGTSLQCIGTGHFDLETRHLEFSNSTLAGALR
ncbi:MAG: hypothetical protein ACLFWZ_12045 [Coleofasciculus sp.]